MGVAPPAGVISKQEVHLVTQIAALGAWATYEEVAIEVHGAKKLQGGFANLLPARLSL